MPSDYKHKKAGMSGRRDAMKRAMKKALPTSAAKGLKTAAKGIGKKVASAAKDATDRRTAIKELIRKKNS